ncbi:MAG: hypothetical protein WD226_06115 [Planctomycetota bacterium]
MMKLLTRSLLPTLALLGGLCVAACEKEPFEDAGEATDEAFDDAGEAIDDAVDETGDAVDDIGDGK